LGWVRIAETKPTIARLQTAYKPDPTATLGGTASIDIMQAGIQYGSQTGSPGGNARIFGVRSDTNGRTELTTTARIDKNFRPATRSGSIPAARMARRSSSGTSFRPPPFPPVREPACRLSAPSEPALTRKGDHCPLPARGHGHVAAAKGCDVAGWPCWAWLFGRRTRHAGSGTTPEPAQIGRLLSPGSG
jgi:hypothetical protein